MYPSDKRRKLSRPLMQEERMWRFCLAGAASGIQARWECISLDPPTSIPGPWNGGDEVHTEGPAASKNFVEKRPCPTLGIGVSLPALRTMRAECAIMHLLERRVLHGYHSPA